MVSQLLLSQSRLHGYVLSNLTTRTSDAYQILSPGLGYLVGPTVGSLIFKAMNGSRNKAIEVMDKR
jgi:hypothetical protein